MYGVESMRALLAAEKRAVGSLSISHTHSVSLFLAESLSLSLSRCLSFCISPSPSLPLPLFSPRCRALSLVLSLNRRAGTRVIGSCTETRVVVSSDGMLAFGSPWDASQVFRDRVRVTGLGLRVQGSGLR